VRVQFLTRAEISRFRAATKATLQTVEGFIWPTKSSLGG
jgi:hypothetical protein